jgi:hypothetical protein
MNLSRILATLGLVLIFCSVIYLVFFDQIKSAIQAPLPTISIPQTQIKSHITSAVTDEDCQIKLKLNTNSDKDNAELVTIPTSFDPTTSQCQEYMLKLISPSQDYLAFEDLDETGEDTLIKAWSTQNRQVREVGTVAPDSVIDMTFLPEDILAVLHGENLSRGKQTIRLYDLNQANRPFITLKLEDASKHYYFIATKDNKLQVHGPDGIEFAPIQSWELDEVMQGFRNI